MQSKRSMPLGVRAKCALVWTAAVLLTALAWTEGTQAQTGVCIKTVTAPAAVDGVVAPGTATAACASDALWAGVGPAQFQPLGSPDGRLYLAYYVTGGNRHLRIGINVAGDDDLSDFDVVSLFFDANNSNTWDAGDFVLQVKVSPSISPITTGELCNQTTGAVKYYQRVGSSWSSTGTEAAAAAVVVKHAYDYSSAMPDTETKIWNLEIDIPIGFTSGDNTFFNLTTTGPNYFGIGGYVFADYNHQQTPQQGTVLKWPGGIAANPGIADADPAFSEPNVMQLANASLTSTCFDVNFSAPNPWRINGNPAASQDHRINRMANNTFRVTYYFDGPETAVTPMANPGNVKLALTPYRASGPGTAWTKTIAIPATGESNYNQERTVDFQFDFNAPDASFGSVSDVNFVCATTTLESFARDDDHSNNSLNVNYNYFTTSEYRQEFRLYGSAVPNLKPSQTARVLIKADMTNELPELRSPETGTSKLVMFVLVLLIILVLLAVVLRRRGVPWVVTLLNLAVVLVIGILLGVFLNVGRTPIGTARWTVNNAAQVALEPVKGRPGWYQTVIGYEEVKTVELTFRGQPLPYTTHRHRLDAAREGKPNRLEIPVKPGNIVTVLAFGEVDVDGSGPLPPTSATGFTEQTAGHQANYLLSRGRYRPNEYAGALIGSFDGFQTSFVIGRDSSIFVPEQATSLTLAVNARLPAYTALVGGYDIFTIATPAPNVPTHTRLSGDATYFVPPRLNLWEVLTSLNLYTYYEAETIRDGAVRSRNVQPWGEAHFSIYASHAGQQNR